MLITVSFGAPTPLICFLPVKKLPDIYRSLFTIGDEILYPNGSGANVVDQNVAWSAWFIFGMIISCPCIYSNLISNFSENTYIPKLELPLV